MNTIILMWNTNISSFKMSDYEEGLRCFWNFQLNWSIWDYKHIHKGDRFFMIRVGNNNAGVIMSGYLNSDPYIGKDWSGKERVVYYADLKIEAMIHPEKMKILSYKELSDIDHNFNWTVGHSGRILCTGLSNKLEKKWKEILAENHTLIEDMESRLFRLRYISTNDPTPTVKEIEFPDKIIKLFNKNLHDAIIGKISFDREANTLHVRIDYYENHFCISFENVIKVVWDTDIYNDMIFETHIHKEGEYIIADFDGTYLKVISKKVFFLYEKPNANQQVTTKDGF